MTPAERQMNAIIAACLKVGYTEEEIAYLFLSIKHGYIDVTPMRDGTWLVQNNMGKEQCSLQAWLEQQRGEVA